MLSVHKKGQKTALKRPEKNILNFFQKRLDKMRRLCYNINVVANAAVAQLVEHMLGKHEVTSSNLVISSTPLLTSGGVTKN